MVTHRYLKQFFEFFIYLIANKPSGKCRDPLIVQTRVRNNELQIGNREVFGKGKYHKETYIHLHSNTMFCVKPIHPRETCSPNRFGDCVQQRHVHRPDDE